MPRNISFALTTEQIKNKTKTVTRRKGWKFLKVGDVLNACVKCMGLKPGEKIQRLGQIRVTDVKREVLNEMRGLGEGSYGSHEATLEGFPEMSGIEFTDMFCEHMGGDIDQEVTRIEFEYLDENRQWFACGFVKLNAWIQRLDGRKFSLLRTKAMPEKEARDNMWDMRQATESPNWEFWLEPVDMTGDEYEKFVPLDVRNEIETERYLDAASTRS